MSYTQFGCMLLPVSRVIQVRHVPDDVHAELRRRAAGAGVSLSDYVLDELTRIARRSHNAEVLLRAAMRPSGARHDQIIGAIESGRRARAEQLG